MSPRWRIFLPALAAVALVVLIVAIALGKSSGGDSSSVLRPSSGEGFDGAAIPVGLQAPEFTLTDQYGHRLGPGQLRGKVTVLSFLYSGCGAPCVVIAQQIRGALDELPEAVPVLIVSANPRADTPANVRRFLAQVSLTGRVRYLSGSPAQLQAIWRAYKVVPASAGRRAFADHASVLLIDGKGNERVLFQSEQLTPEALSHDIRRLQAG
ncbi:MAG TPA: SCO family protein [Solirubrobacteraceae bacterium]|nr:SCO family protein [Solirubrobacteraceae bacterium]